LIGAVLLTGLTTDFHNNVTADSSIPPNVQQQLVKGTEEGVAMVSKSQAESVAKKQGLSQQQVNAVVNSYSEAQIQALKRALLAASFFVLVGAWFARTLPNEPLPKEGEPAAEPVPAPPGPELEPVPQA
jgi:hypothetical protein